MSVPRSGAREFDLEGWYLAAARAADGSAEVDDEADGLGIEAVAGFALDLAANDPGFLQDLEVLGDGRLRQGEDIDEFAGLADPTTGEFRNDPDARGVAEGSKDLGGTFFVFRQSFNRLHASLTYGVDTAFMVS